MKSKKLALNQLAVKSFVTEMSEKTGQTVKGGSDTPFPTLQLICGDTIIPRRCPSMLCP